MEIQLHVEKKFHVQQRALCRYCDRRLEADWPYQTHTELESIVHTEAVITHAGIHNIM